MAVQWETVAVPLSGGIDTKTDAKLVAPTKLLALENGDFTKGGSVRGRFGYREVPAEDVDGQPITDALGLAALNDGFVLLGRKNAYMLDQVKNAWSVLGAYTPVVHQASPIAYSSAAQTTPDMDTANGVTAVAWADSRGGVRCTVLDDDSGAAFVGEYSLAASNASLPRVTAVGTNLLITWFDNGSTAIKCRVVKTTDVSGSIGSADVILAPDANAAAQYDIVGGDGCAYLTFRQDAAVADLVRLIQLNSAGTAIGAVNASSVIPDAGPALTWNPDTNTLYLTYYETATTNVTVSSFDGSTLVLQNTVTNAVGSPAINLALSCNDLGGVSVWYIDTANVGPVYVRRLDSSLALDSNYQVNNVTLCSSGFWDGYNGYAILRYCDSTYTNLQNSYFIYRDDGVVVGRMLYGGAPEAAAVWPRVKSYGADKFQVALGFNRQVEGNLDKITGAGVKLAPIFEHQGIQRVTLDMAPAISTALVDGVLYTTGGFLWAIDGAGSPVEADFQLFPEMVTSLVSVTAGGSLTASADYNYRVYYEWVNGLGQRVRSFAVEFTATTDASNKTVSLNIPTLTLSRMDVRSPVSIVVYRGLANDNSFYYRVSSSDPTSSGDNSYLANDPTLDAIIGWVDSMSDATAGQQEIDYQSKGKVPRFAFDGAGYLAAAQNRLFSVGSGEQPDRPQYSLLREDGLPVETSDTFVVTEFPALGGAVTAVGQLNGVPVIFKQRAIYTLIGDGPANNGSFVGRNPYAAETVSTDVGCTDPGSVVSARDGVYFKSAKGIYLLGLDFKPVYIGADVEAYNGQTVTAAALVPDTNQVLFLTNSGATLMYDWYYKAWGTYTNHEGIALATTEADLAYLRNDGRVFIRDTGLYTDAGNSYELYFRTAPLHLENTIQGFWRARRLQVVGSYSSSHKLRAEVFYDRELAPYQTFLFQPDSVLDLDPWGSDTVWGSSGPWGGALDALDYNFDEKLKRQKCSTISFAFRGVPGATPGASFELTELALEVGLRKGLARLPATRKP